MAEVHPGDKELEADDPYEFVAVRFPMPEGVDGEEAMARTFIEEFAIMGMPRTRMMSVFASQFFAGANSIYESRGPEFIQSIIDDVYGPQLREV